MTRYSTPDATLMLMAERCSDCGHEPGEQAITLHEDIFAQSLTLVAMCHGLKTALDSANHNESADRFVVQATVDIIAVRTQLLMETLAADTAAGREPSSQASYAMRTLIVPMLQKAEKLGYVPKFAVDGDPTDVDSHSWVRPVTNH